MKSAIILHGSSETPESYWYPSIKNFLELRKYVVWAPQLPRPEAPDLKLQLPFVLNGHHFNKDTVIVAHSAGCPLALSVLENLDVSIDKAILVSGYARRFTRMKDARARKEEKDAAAIVQNRYDWAKIRASTRSITFINSDNDPWGCDDREGRYMFTHLGGTLILRHGEGHMGSTRFGQPYKEFPLLEKLLLL